MCLGDIEMTFGLPTYAQTVQCTEAAEMFVLDQKNYDRLIEKRNPQSLDLMRDFLHEKLQVRMSWAQDENLPLFRYFLYKLDERKRQESNRWKEFNRKRDLRETIDYWKSGKLNHGPLIDQFGPGSVFYTIRMKAKSRKGFVREKSKNAFGVLRTFTPQKNQSGAYFSRKGDYRNSNLNISSENGTASKLNSSNKATKQSRKHKFASSDDSDDGGSETDTDFDEIDGPVGSRAPRGRLVCEKGARKLRERKTRSSCSVEEMMNHELNELALSRLENRIDEWHSRVNKLEGERPSRQNQKHTVKLHRYIAEVGRSFS